VHILPCTQRALCEQGDVHGRMAMDVTSNTWHATHAAPANLPVPPQQQQQQQQPQTLPVFQFEVPPCISISDDEEKQQQPQQQQPQPQQLPPQTLPAFQFGVPPCVSISDVKGKQQEGTSFCFGVEPVSVHSGVQVRQGERTHKLLIFDLSISAYIKHLVDH